jgi:hypothetical protein
MSIPSPNPQRLSSTATPQVSGVNTVIGSKSIGLLGRPSKGNNGIGIRSTSSYPVYGSVPQPEKIRGMKIC